MRKTDIQRDTPIRARILHPREGVTEATWHAGRDVQMPAVKKFYDEETDALYVLVHYRAGHPQMSATTREIWQGALDQFSNRKNAGK